ncbi:ferrous iron transport protein B [Sulfurospirillum sp. T05]|uniref:Ferrous iron transport protein B n=1 Tax=Sulfurospirillum tamanense TaxID=2813362 RepID=A0ABS2WTA3_9BACT|nr:ferrous iron transport protein B [Sulfurospirillum tamanensis]MBN2964404.1 ferrous iron transport protein B [Sulfurospirillum tamanensis]
MIKVALAGQPNCGKSTIFNLISGLKQHIANYPGVTVEKKSGTFSHQGETIEVVDLPGTYSFSSYSLEERVAKEFILNEEPDIIVNVVDASNIKRNLYLTFQLLEIGKPVVVVLNMMDVAARRGMDIDVQKIARMLSCPVVPASGARGEGKEAIVEAIMQAKTTPYNEFKINYEELEPLIKETQALITTDSPQASRRWLAIKALEGDGVILEKLPKATLAIREKCLDFHRQYDKDVESFLATMRYDSADVIYHQSVVEKQQGKKTATDIADGLILNRWLSFPILFLIIFLIYQSSIVYGYKLTDYTWPLLAAFKNFIIGISPEADFTQVPMITDFAIWMVNSANALLNYIPIFLILFALIAILEDVGYMPRMAFILDRIFKKFGLHGQSTLPLVLGGAFVGGCAVPGIMATKGIADERARMATILSVPYMNCLAKVPFYTLLLGAFFEAQMALMMFFISTATLFIALIVAKILTATVLKTRETSPFVMELPPYHLPTFKGVIFRAFERVWMYIKKVGTIVLAVAIVLFAMLELPGLSDEQKVAYEARSDALLTSFYAQAAKTSYGEQLSTRESVSGLLNTYDDYRARRMSASPAQAGNIDADFEAKAPFYMTFIKPPADDAEAKTINRQLRNLSRDRRGILQEMKNDKVESSLLGFIGRSLEPVTQFAGFDWKINVAFLSSFAARESAVATLGSIYENNAADNLRAEEAMAQNSGYTPLHAAAIIIFMLLTPPCIATMIVVKLQTGSYKWMLFAIFFPITLGFLAASLIFTLGTGFGWSGVEAFALFYGTVIALALFMGSLPQKRINWSGGFTKSILNKS